MPSGVVLSSRGRGSRILDAWRHDAKMIKLLKPTTSHENLTDAAMKLLQARMKKLLPRHLVARYDDYEDEAHALFFVPLPKGTPYTILNTADEGERLITEFRGVVP